MASVEDLQNQLSLYQQTEARILNGAQEAQIGGRRYTLASLKDVQAKIKDLEMRLAIAQNTVNGRRVTHSQPVFYGRRNNW
jgi:hypothetical protein